MKRINLIGIAIFVASFIFGCEKVEENYYFLPDDYETLDGIYRVHVVETEDSCDPETEFINRWDWLMVTVQEKRWDGGYLVDFSLSNLAWFDVTVEADGEFDAEYDFVGIYLQQMYGVLTPDEIYAAIELPLYERDGDLICTTNYNVEGYKLFVTLPPPEDMAR